MKAAYDALIVGAGPAGCTAAILLASAGWSVALIERQPFPRRKVCGACISASNLPLLAALGVGGAFARLAGPELREVALYCGERSVRAPLPVLSDARHAWGRALDRATFDLLLLERAREVGTDIWQPWTLRHTAGVAGDFCCVIESPRAADRRTLRAPVLIMANGSWEPDSASPVVRRKSSDLFAFASSFGGSPLAPGLLPVISFAGGYGGLAIAENGHLTLAGCIRRDVLRTWRAAAPQRTAGEAFELGLRARTQSLRAALDGATRAGAWLAIGPMRPGIRSLWRSCDGAFMIGNAAAEAHPIIGEGISMAMQSAWILCEGLLDTGMGASANALRKIGAAYERQWRQSFGPRLHLAAFLAHAAMKPWLAPTLWPMIARKPQIMTAMARRAGKARMLPGGYEFPRHIS